MKYFVVTIIYEGIDIVNKAFKKDFIVEEESYPKIKDMLEAPEYEIQGYRRVGVSVPTKVSKVTADALRTIH